MAGARQRHSTVCRAVSCGPRDDDGGGDVVVLWGRERSSFGRLAYVWPQDVVGDGRLVDGRVLVRLEMDQGIVRDAFGDSFLYTTSTR